MFKKVLACALALAACGASAEEYNDYISSKEVWSITFVNVKPNRLDEYLMGVKQTWISSCEEQKKLGTLVDCSVMVSENSASRDFNLLLVLKAPSAAVSDPDEATYRKLQAALQARLAKDKRDAIVLNYDTMRTMYGQQRFRQITFK